MVTGTISGLVELVGPDLGVEVVPLLVEGEQAVDLLGTLGDLVEVAEGAQVRPLRPAARAAAMTPSKSISPTGTASWAARSAAIRPTVNAAAPMTMIPTHEALLKWQRLGAERVTTARTERTGSFQDGVVVRLGGPGRTA